MAVLFSGQRRNRFSDPEEKRNGDTGQDRGQKGILGAEWARLRLQTKPVLTQRVGTVGPFTDSLFAGSSVRELPGPSWALFGV